MYFFVEKLAKSDVFIFEGDDDRFNLFGGLRSIFGCRVEVEEEILGRKYSVQLFSMKLKEICFRRAAF